MQVPTQELFSLLRSYKVTLAASAATYLWSSCQECGVHYQHTIKVSVASDNMAAKHILCVKNDFRKLKASFCAALQTTDSHIATPVK